MLRAACRKLDEWRGSGFFYNGTVTDPNALVIPGDPSRRASR
jgi:hypothetical protein